MKVGDSDLDVRLDHRVHPGLSINIGFRLGRETGVLFGPSGAGKSTILRLIAGLIRPDRGWVRLGGRDLTRVRLRDRQIGFIFQDDLLFPHLDVASNVRFGLGRLSKHEASERSSEVAALCGIESLMTRRVETLSGGERQRVGLARAIAPRPRLLLCDEPVSALGVDARHALIDRLDRVGEILAIPILYVTHSPTEAVAVGRRLFWLDGGRIVAEGTPIDVLAQRSWSGSLPWDSLRNNFRARVVRHERGGITSTIQIEDGPTLTVPGVDGPVGSDVLVVIEADDVVLAREPIGPISARNRIEGRVTRLVEHGSGVEVLIQTGGASWIVGVVPSAVEAMGLIAGSEVLMIVKSRSCRVMSRV